MKNKRNIIYKLKIQCLLLLIGFTSNLIANDDINLQFLEESKLIALPELSIDKNKNLGKLFKSVPQIKCFVDTPAYDYFTLGNCDNAGWAYSTSVIFKVFNILNDYTIIQWSDSRCDSNSNTCILPIRQYQTVELNADFTSNSAPYFLQANAYYEGMF